MIALREYESVIVPFDALSESVIGRIQTTYPHILNTELLVYPQKQWRLTAAGTVGAIVVDGVTVLIRPKIPLANLFHLLDIAHDLNIRHLPNLTSSATIRDFYDRLATRLAELVLVRVRQGLFRNYSERDAALPYVRGRLRVRELKVGQTTVPVRYEEFSADNRHNQYLLAALHHISRTRLCRNETQGQVRKAFQTLRGIVTLQTFSGRERFEYSRLNGDYRPMHALCRFFLTHTAPLHTTGQQDTPPFLIEMSTLFEQFVANWLRDHLPNDYTLTIQERSLAGNAVQVAIDLVITERETARVWAVLDTKWKAPTQPANSDIYQITFYANSRQSPRAILIYPTPLRYPLNAYIDNIHLHTLIFDVSDNIEIAGQTFLAQLNL